MTKPKKQKRDKICSKTLSGKHLFMPLSDSELLRVWEIHGIYSPFKCIVCGIIDDLRSPVKK